MAATTVKGTLITSLEAKPFVQGPVGSNGGNLKAAVTTTEIATTSIDEVNDVVLVLPLPADARLISLVLFNDDLDTNGSPGLVVHVGGFYGHDVIGQTSGTVIDADGIASSITTLQAANTTGVELIGEANPIEDIGKPLFDIMGLTTNPGGTIYIGLTVTVIAATAAAGTITLRALYV
jgi:hypothetical protein